MLTQVHLYIKGEVINVGFRAWTKIQTKSKKVSGWIRNVYDRPEIFGRSGGVEAVIQGEENVVLEMIEIIKQGPSIARVDDVEIIWQEPKQVLEGFEIRK